MNRTEHLLVNLSEECAEVTQRVTKALRFGLEEVQAGQAQDNRTRLKEELSDLLAVVDLLTEEGIIDAIKEKDKTRKRLGFEKYLLHSKSCGRLDTNPEVRVE